MKYLLCLLAILAFDIRAADHGEAPQVRVDSLADLNDLYAFINPNNADELIMVATVAPNANASTQFSDAVDYRFHISTTDNPGDYSVLSCSFEEADEFSCAFGDNSPVTGALNSTVEGGSFRVYAGLRDDPFYFDGGAFAETVATLSPQFKTEGVNSFAGQNVLALVIGIRSSDLTKAGSEPVLRVYASTNRKSGAVLNGSTSGSFYNVDQSGHGFQFQVISQKNADDQTQVSANWFVFDDDGNPIWLTGEGPVDGLTARIPVQRLSGGRFPPNFNTEDVNRIAAGELLFTFSDCNNASVEFETADASFLASTSLGVQRLTSVQGLPCGHKSLGQVDRVGRPAIATALIDITGAQGTKDTYNAAADPSKWSEQFEAEIRSHLELLDSLDGATNALLPAASLASVLVDDVLLIDTRESACDEYLAVELSVAGKCGGRTLARDVIDDTLSAVVAPGAGDGVANDSTFLDDFPFLAEPN